MPRWILGGTCGVSERSQIMTSDGAAGGGGSQHENQIQSSKQEEPLSTVEMVTPGILAFFSFSIEFSGQAKSELIFTAAESHAQTGLCKVGKRRRSKIGLGRVEKLSGSLGRRLCIGASGLSLQNERGVQASSKKRMKKMRRSQIPVTFPGSQGVEELHARTLVKMAIRCPLLFFFW